MLFPQCRVIIGSFEFNFTTDIEIKASWELLTSTAKITMPRELKYQGRPLFNGTDPLVKIGDPVEIWLGYYPNSRREFKGYVSEMKPSLPMEIYCEDGMWKLKQKKINHSFKKTTLKGLMEEVLKGTEFENNFFAADVDLGAYRIPNWNVAQVFEDIKKTYRMFAFIREGKLYCGLPYTSVERHDQEFSFQEGILPGHDLIFKKKEDMRITIKVSSKQSKGKDTKVEIGDGDGDVVSLDPFTNKTEKELQSIAEEELKRLKYTGWRGKFTSFGEPYVAPGDSCTLTDKYIPEINGTYLIKSTEVRFGTGGFRRTIEPDQILTI